MNQRITFSATMAAVLGLVGTTAHADPRFDLPQPPRPHVQVNGSVPQPSVPAPHVGVPSLPQPSLPAPSVPRPSLPAPPRVSAPSLPAPPAMPRPSLPAPPRVSAPSLPAPPALPRPSLPAPPQVSAPARPAQPAMPVPQPPEMRGPEMHSPHMHGGLPMPSVTINGPGYVPPPNVYVQPGPTYVETPSYGYYATAPAPVYVYRPGEDPGRFQARMEDMINWRLGRLQDRVQQGELSPRVLDEAQEDRENVEVHIREAAYDGVITRHEAREITALVRGIGAPDTRYGGGPGY